MLRTGQLRADVVLEPLWNQWYAWSYLIPPACAARYVAHSHLPVMQSFVDAPQVHVDALRDPAMIGGPFIQYGIERAQEVAALLERTRRDQRHLLALDNAITALEAALEAHPRGASLEPLYAELPPALGGMVELVYDARDRPSIRFIEALFYRSDFYRSAAQSIALRRVPDVDQRAFVMSTPRLEADLECHLPLSFADPRLDDLCRLRTRSGNIGELAEALELNRTQREAFAALFVEGRDAEPSRPHGNEVRVRYLGHACVLVESADVAVLVDPLIGYAADASMPRLSYADLPEHIDYALITHNHQDHVMFETLLQLRHRIGTVVVARGQKGSLLDPSLKLTLQQVGFARVHELDELESLAVPGGEIIGLPLLGEHGDLNIATKTAYWITINGRSIVCAADSNNIDDRLYRHLRHLLGRPDVVFIGMECDGAPYSWAYGPLLPAPVPHQQAQSRRLDGSDSARALRLVESLGPEQVYVYAMGLEPWLHYITSIHYEPDSAPMVESDRLVAECHRRGITCERLMGCRDLMFEGRASTPRTQPSPLPIPDDAYELTDVTMAAAPAAPRGPAAAQSADETKAQALTEFLKRLTRLDVRLRLKDGELRVSAPKGALDAELTASLRAFKPQIVNLLEGAPSRSASASAPASGPSSSPDAPWREDLKLALEIQPVRTTGKKLDQASHILLTGATGFLGPYVLFELLQQTTARISCLVRGNSVADAGSRLRDALRAFDLWRDEYASRIEPIVGDLGKPLLGMPRSTFDALADRVDTIFHNGAQVHHAMPYEQLRQVNVLGTQEVLRLAAAGEEAIPVHYVSTLSVLPAAALADRARFFEHDLIAEYPPPAGGYNLSKWVAENLLVEARQRGAAVTVYRPGPVSGDSRSGAYNENDFLFRLMSGYVESGLAPDGATLIDVLPVDFVARAIVTLARSTATSHATFHLLHPQPVSSELLFDVCRDAGVPIRRVPYDQWFEHLKTIARDASDHALFPLVALFSSRRGREMAAATPTELPFDTSAADAALATVELAPPALDRELFRTYLRALLGTFVGDTARSDEPAADAGASR